MTDGAWKQGFCERGREKGVVFWRELLGENQLGTFGGGSIGGRKRVKNAGWDLRRAEENETECKKAGKRGFL